MILMGDGYLIDDGCTAKGTETKPQKHWRDPHSSVSSVSLGPRARLLQAAIGGDLRAETTLIKRVAAEVKTHASFAKDNLQGKQVTLTHLAFYPYIYQAKPHSERESAFQLGVSRSSYRRIWHPRVEVIRDQWCKRLRDELTG